MFSNNDTTSANGSEFPDEFSKYLYENTRRDPFESNQLNYRYGGNMSGFGYSNGYSSRYSSGYGDYCGRGFSSG